MAMNLYKAHNQWATRPEDERFWDLREMIEATRRHREMAAESTVAVQDLRVEARDGEVALVGKTNQPACLTNWAFGQVSTLAGAPASYLRQLPATLAAQNLNHGLKQKGANRDDEARLLLHRNGHLMVGALTSTRYKRIWDHEVLERFARILPEGWRVPPAYPVWGREPGPRARAATESDCFPGTSVQVGQMIEPAGLYASDHDFFLFMVNPERQIDAGYDDHGLMRGIMMGNSIVGAMSFWIAKFAFDHVCGNHIIWSAQDYQELRVRHVGNADERVFSNIKVEMVKYANESTSDMEAKIKSARSMVLGATKDEAIDALLSFVAKRKLQIPQKSLAAAYEIAEQTPRYGDPKSVWAFHSGLTELSQRTAFTDDRTKLDRAAGKVLEMAF